MKQKKIVNYRKFYLVVCYTEKNEPIYVGTIYSKKFDKYRDKTNHHYYSKVVYEYGKEITIERMKKEVDMFLEKFRKYLESQIEETTIQYTKLVSELNSLP
jgi:hypothetical protein